MAIHISGLAIDVHNDKGFMQRRLIQKRNLRKDLEVVCALVGHDFQIGVDKPENERKTIEMHTVHAVIAINDKDAASFKIVRDKDAILFKAETIAIRDDWVKALQKSLGSAKDSFGKNVSLESMKIQESINLEKSNDYVSRSFSKMDPIYAMNNNNKPQLQKSQSVYTEPAGIKFFKQTSVDETTTTTYAEKEIPAFPHKNSLDLGQYPKVEVRRQAKPTAVNSPTEEPIYKRNERLADANGRTHFCEKILEVEEKAIPDKLFNSKSVDEMKLLLKSV